jgi:hypothetical protein
MNKTVRIPLIPKGVEHRFLQRGVRDRATLPLPADSAAVIVRVPETARWKRTVRASWPTARSWISARSDKFVRTPNGISPNGRR